MANDISTSTWSETDNSNNSSTPNGWPEGQSPSSVNDCARMMMGAIKRFWHRINGTQTAGGTANALTLTYAVAPAAYVAGESYTFQASASNSTATTLNVNGLGALPVYKATPAGITALAGGELFSSMVVTATLNAGLTAFVINGLAGSSGTVTSVATAGLATGGPVTGSGTVTVTASTKAQMQTGTDTTTAVTPARVNDSDGTAKAWVVFDGTASGPITPAASFNVSGTITKNGTGDYTIAWTVPFASANYAVVAMGQLNGGSATGIAINATGSIAAGSVRILCVSGGSVADLPHLGLVAYGRQ